MAEYSYMSDVISSLLRGMNSDAPWQHYYSANRVTGSAFWFVFNLFGRFVLMRMFLESVAVSQVPLPLRPAAYGALKRAQYSLLQEKYVVQVRAAPACDVARSEAMPRSSRRSASSAKCLPSCAAEPRPTSLLN
jgi:hypothetical protein